MIIAGPPCQGFSLTGPRNFDDKRNRLYLAVIEMVKEYKPKGFIIENVPGMTTLYQGQIKDEILKRFRKMGYNIECKILIAADYGVPQMRKRLIFMGIRKDIGVPHFPEPKFTPKHIVLAGMQSVIFQHVLIGWERKRMNIRNRPKQNIRNL
ncbi:MAG: DNA cytosine methyltransferase [Waltera sp.]